MFDRQTRQRENNQLVIDSGFKLDTLSIKKLARMANFCGKTPQEYIDYIKNQPLIVQKTAAALLSKNATNQSRIKEEPKQLEIASIPGILVLKKPEKYIFPQLDGTIGWTKDVYTKCKSIDGFGENADLQVFAICKSVQGDGGSQSSVIDGECLQIYEWFTSGKFNPIKKTCVLFLIDDAPGRNKNSKRLQELILNHPTQSNSDMINIFVGPSSEASKYLKGFLEKQ